MILEDLETVGRYNFADFSNWVAVAVGLVNAVLGYAATHVVHVFSKSNLKQFHFYLKNCVVSWHLWLVF